MPQFALEVIRAALTIPDLLPSISISRQCEKFRSFAELGSALFPVDTFDANVGALSQAWHIPFIRREFYRRLKRDRIEAVVELMPHVWSPFVMPVVRAAGARYCTIVHDADAHPGDQTSLVKSFLDRSAHNADTVLTLSSAVARRLTALGKVKQENVRTLFHPDLRYGGRMKGGVLIPGEALKLLFFGRIMPYKGLPLFLDMIDCLKEATIPVEIGVFGEGDLGPSADRLVAHGAEVVNRWLDEAEIADMIPRYHAMVLSHTEASQSGVVAAAFGAALPVITTPVGGLVEQVDDGVTGVVAKEVSAPALAEAAMRLFRDPERYRAICENIEARADQRSMSRFVEEIANFLLSERSRAN